MLGAWMWLSFIYISLSLLFGIGDFATSAIIGNVTAIESLMQFKVMTVRDFNFLFWSGSVPIPNTSFFNQLSTMLTWDYNMFQGDLNIVRWIVLGPLGVAFSLMVLLQVGPLFLQFLATMRQLIPRIGPFS